MSKTKVPAIPAPTESNLRDVARAVKGLLDVREGLLGDPLDKSVTFRDLVDGGLATPVVVGRGGGAGAISLTPAPGLGAGSEPEVDLTPPPAPTGLAAAAGIAVIILSWDAPTYGNHAFTEIWRSEDNVLGNAVRVATTETFLYTDNLGVTGAQRYYWIRHRSTADVAGPYNATNGVSATTGKIGNVDLGPLIVEAGNLASGAVTATKLAAEAVSLTSFASGIEPVAVVQGSTLPTAKSTSTIFLAGTGKLYRWNGTAYTAAVPTVDLSGTIVESQIADGSVVAAKIADATLTTAKFASGIEPLTIVTGALPTTKSTSTIFRTDDSKTYRWNGSAYVATVPAADIAGQVTDAQVAGLAASKVTGQLTNAQIADVAAAKLTGQIVESQIADAAISTAKFASGLEPITVVTGSTLPTTKSTNSIYLTGTGKLYRWVGAAYSAVVDTSDLNGTISDAQLAGIAASKITGQLTNSQIADVAAAKLTGAVSSAQIADGSISGTKFASGIEPVTVVSSVPDTKSTNTIFNTTDGKLYRWNGTAYVASVATADLSGTISDAQIAAMAASKVTGQLSDSQIAAVAAAKVTGQLTASQLNVAVGGANLIPNSGFEADSDADGLADSWVSFTGGSGDSGRVQVASRVTGAPGVLGSFAQRLSITSVTNNTDSGISISNIPVDAGTKYALSGHVRSNSATVSVRIRWYNASLAPITDDVTPASSASQAWARLQVVVTAPAGAVRSDVMIRGITSPGEYFEVDGVQLEASEIVTAYAPRPAEVLPGTITATEISDNAITTPKLVAGAVVAGKIAADAVTADKIAANAVTAGKIEAGAVTTAKLAAGAVTADTIASNAITAAKIESGAITTAKLAAGAVTAATIAADAITSDKIAANAVTADEIAANAVTTGKIAAGSVTADQLSANSITADKLAANAVTAEKIDAGAVTTAKLAVGAVTADAIASNAITAAKIEAGAITTAKLAAGAVTANEIAASTITGGKIAAGTITGSNIAADTITSGQIAAGAITASEIASGAITTNKLLVTGRGTALNDDPMFQDPSAWQLGPGTSFASNTSVAGAVANTYIGSSSGTDRITYSDKTFPIGPGKRYRLSANVYADTGNTRNLYLLVQFYDQNGNYVDSTVTGWGGTMSGYTYGGAPPTGVWTRVGAQFGTGTSLPIPASVRSVQIGVWFNYSGGPGSSQVLQACQDLRLEELVESDVIVDGAITASKVQAGAITTAKLAAGAVTADTIASNAITAAKIEAGAVTTAKLAAGAVTANEIAASTITGGKIAAGTITGSNIAADTITAGQIAAGAISASEVAAGAITVQKLLVAPVSLCPDPYFSDTAWWTATLFDANGWYFESGTGFSGTTVQAALWSGHPTNNPGTARKHIWSGNVPAPAPGTNLRIRARMRNESNQNAYVTARFYDSSGSSLAGDIGVGSPAYAGQNDLSAQGVVPNNAAYIRFIIYNEGSTALNGAISASAVMLDVAASADLIVDGAVTAAKVQAGAITTAKLAAGAVTANEISSGAITTEKLAANAVTANEIAANAITTGKIAAGAVSASQIAAGAITTDKLLVTGQGAALNDDPNTQDVTAWTGSGLSIITDATSPAGNTVLRCATAGETVLSRRVAIDPTRNHQFRIWTRQETGSSTTYLTVAFADANGTNISGGAAGWSQGTYHYFGLVNGALPAAWTEYRVSFGPNEAFTIPAGARYVRVGVLSNYTGTGTQLVTGVRLMLKADADLIVDGAITANKIAANAIAVGTAAIQNGAIVNAMIGDMSATKITAGYTQSVDIEAGKFFGSQFYIGGTPTYSFIDHDADPNTAQIKNGIVSVSNPNISMTSSGADFDVGYFKIKNGASGTPDTVFEVSSGIVRMKQAYTQGLAVTDASGNIILGAGTPLQAANFAGQIGGGNLLYNSSFELDSTTAGVPAGWTATSIGTGVTLTRTTPSSTWNAGKCLRLTVSALSSPSTTFHAAVQTTANQVAVVPGQKYVISFAAKTSTLIYRAYYGVYFYQADGATASTINSSDVFTHTFTSAGTWERETQVITTPSDAAFVRIRIGISRNDTTTLGNIEFDDLQFELGDVPTTYKPSVLDVVGVANPVTAGNISTFIAAGVIGDAYIANVLQSTNYSSSAGWQINKAGTATFNEVALRGAINGGAFTGFAWPASGAGGGFHLGPSGLLLGNYNTVLTGGKRKYLQINSDGNVYAPGFSIVDGDASFSGTLSANIVNTAQIVGGAAASSATATSTTASVSVTVNVPSGASALLISYYLGPPTATQNGDGKYGQGTTTYGPILTGLTDNGVTTQTVVVSPSAGNHTINVTRSYYTGTMRLGVVVLKR